MTPSSTICARFTARNQAAATSSPSAENGTVLGGCGFAEAAVFDPLRGAQKVYLSDAAKGKRVGRRLSETVEQAARDAGYETLYIETHSKFDAAIRLYEKLGFQQIDKPQGVQHGAMDHFYLKSL